MAPLGNSDLASGNTAPRGAASNMDGSRVWVVDANDKVFVYDQNGAALGSWRATGVQTAEGIAMHGDDIWILDGAAKRVLHFKGAASRLTGQQSAADSFTLDRRNAPAYGITTDGFNLWVVDDGPTNQVFIYDTTGTLVGNWAIDATNYDPRGITIDPGNVDDIWIVDRQSDSIYHYPGAASVRSGRLSAAAITKLDSNNRGPEGIADPRVTAHGTVPAADLLVDTHDGSFAADPIFAARDQAFAADPLAQPLLNSRHRPLLLADTSTLSTQRSAIVPFKTHTVPSFAASSSDSGLANPLLGAAELPISVRPRVANPQGRRAVLASDPQYLAAELRLDDPRASRQALHDAIDLILADQL